MARSKNCGRCNKPKSKCKCGRPTKMTSEVISKLEHAFGISATDREACLYAGILPQTLYTYQKKKPEFVERKSQLKLSPNLKARQTLVTSLDQASGAQWWAERKMKGEFSARQELTGEDGKALFPKPIINVSRNNSNGKDSKDDKKD